MMSTGDIPALPGEVLKLSIQEALVTMFTDDPVNWLKWAVVFAILIGGYAVAVPLYKKVFHGVSWERKRDIAKSKDHVIKAALADKHLSSPNLLPHPCSYKRGKYIQYSRPFITFI